MSPGDRLAPKFLLPLLILVPPLSEARAQTSCAAVGSPEASSSAPRRHATAPPTGCIGGECPNASTTVSLYQPIRELCKVTNSDPNVGGVNNLTCHYDMSAADTGAFALEGDRTWIFFGDALPGDSKVWFRGADPTGYFDGPDPAAGLCGGLELLTVQGMTSNQTCSQNSGAFAPQVVIGPANEPIRDFLFQPVAQPGGAPPLPANSALSGVDEAVTGAFFHDGQIYAFFMGAQGPDTPTHLPVPNVASLTIWDRALSAISPYPTIFRILSKVDFVPSPDTTPPLSAPPGWQAMPPLGGKFVQISPVKGADGYLYIFGTGKYRQSFVYLARMPLASLNSVGAYLSQTPGFEVWTGSGWNATDPTAAAALPFADQPVPDVGEFSVQYAAQVGLWLMMSTSAAGHIVRWSPAPTGPWSKGIVVLNMGVADAQAAYCCQGPAFGNDAELSLPLWSCSQDEMVECVRAISPKVGAPRYGLYAPYMVPMITNVSSSTTTQNGARHILTRFQVDYMLSAFSPYDRILMSYQLQVDTTVP